MGSQHALQ
uniref:Uncharacterized protein n=1 Tax=Arundo donax TaxID=35708 RepID=A0A0A9A7U6_ARUDO